MSTYSAFTDQMVEATGLVFLELVRIGPKARGLGRRDHNPTQSYWNSLRPNRTKVCAKLKLWLE